LIGKTLDPAPGSRADQPHDVGITGSLPMSLTSFVGRERELDELRSLLRQSRRLVTLVGIGGIGTTRLALELGIGAGDLGWRHVYFVELATLADPGLVDDAVLESSGKCRHCRCSSGPPSGRQARRTRPGSSPIEPVTRRRGWS